MRLLIGFILLDIARALVRGKGGASRRDVLANGVAQASASLLVPAVAF